MSDKAMARTHMKPITCHPTGACKSWDWGSWGTYLVGLGHVLTDVWAGGGPHEVVHNTPYDTREQDLGTQILYGSCRLAFVGLQHPSVCVESWVW